MNSPESYRRAKAIFLEASDLPRGERTRFVHTQCENDAELEAHVRSLLTADDHEPDFLERSILGDASAAPGAALAPGDRIGPFRIVRPLGEGGMGVVYEAIEDEPSRRVALKLIRPGLFSSRLRSRFRHEIRVLGQLRHPGIAQIYEAGTLDLRGEQVPFFAMELVEGEPLLDAAERQSLSATDRLALIAQVCDAVHHAHQKGVIHRDLKPGNILVEDSPTTADSALWGTAPGLQVKILDFGVARAIDAAEDTPAPSLHTRAGQLIGTLPYMSPEQAAADPGAIDIRSDIYSIGVIAYELLAHQMPYSLEGRSLTGAVDLIRTAEPPRLGTIDRCLKGDAETIIAKALEKEPRLRYQSAADFAADIRRSLRHEPILARPHSHLYQFRKFARRHRAGVAAAAVVLLAMTAATVISTWQARVAIAAKSDADAAKTQSDIDAALARRQSRRATLAAAAAALESGDPIAARRHLEAADSRDRGWGWGYWHSRLDQSLALFEPGDRIVGSHLNRDGSEVTLVTQNGDLYRGPSMAPSLTPVARIDGAPVRLAAFTPDGDRFAALIGDSGRGLALYDTATAHPLQRFDDLPASGGLLEVSDDARVIIAGAEHIPRSTAADELWCFRADQSWAPTRLYTGNSISSVTLSADGNLLVAGYAGLISWNTLSPVPLRRQVFDGADLRFDLSRDGSLLASGGDDKTLTLWDTATGSRLRSMRGHAAAIAALAISPDEAIIASAGNDLTIRLWNARSGETLRTLIGHTARIRSLAFSTDGRTLLSTDAGGAARVWRAGPDDDGGLLRGHTSYIYSVAFPEDETAISAAWDHTVRSWNPTTGIQTSTIRSDPAHGFITSMARSPARDLVATGHKIDVWTQNPLLLWNTRGELLHNLGARIGAVSDIAFSRDGTKLWAAWDHHGLDEFDLTQSPPTPRTVISSIQPRALAVSSDERELFVGLVNGPIRRIDTASGGIAATLQGHTNEVAGLAIHPTRPLLASASLDGDARVWDLGTNTCAQTLHAHWGKVYAAAFSPDGAILATGSDDTTIILWDVATGDELTRLRGHSSYIHALAFSPDGSRLVSGSGDGTVRIWDTLPRRARLQR